MPNTYRTHLRRDGSQMTSKPRKRFQGAVCMTDTGSTFVFPGDGGYLKRMSGLEVSIPGTEDIIVAHALRLHELIQENPIAEIKRPLIDDDLTKSGIPEPVVAFLFSIQHQHVHKVMQLVHTLGMEDASNVVAAFLAHNIKSVGTLNLKALMAKLPWSLDDSAALCKRYASFTTTNLGPYIGIMFEPR